MHSQIFTKPVYFEAPALLRSAMIGFIALFSGDLFARLKGAEAIRASESAESDLRTPRLGTFSALSKTYFTELLRFGKVGCFLRKAPNVFCILHRAPKNRLYKKNCVQL